MGWELAGKCRTKAGAGLPVIAILFHRQLVYLYAVRGTGSIDKPLSPNTVTLLVGRATQSFASIFLHDQN